MRKVQLWHTLLDDHFGGRIWAPNSTISLVTTRWNPTPHVFSGAGCFIIISAYFCENLLIQFHLFFNLLWQMFYGNFINLFSKHNLIFQPSCTDPDWLGNARWLKPSLFSCKKKYLKEISMKYLLCLPAFKNNFIFK